VYVVAWVRDMSSSKIFTNLTSSNTAARSKSAERNGSIDMSVHGKIKEVQMSTYNKVAQASVHGGFVKKTSISTEFKRASFAASSESDEIEISIPKPIPSATMESGKAFSFFDAMPRVRHIPTDLRMVDFTDIQHFADGTNANIYLVRWKGELCIVKIIRKEKKSDPIAAHEFDVEHGLLERVDHPNIISILGAGLDPRRFILLEYLNGGTMMDALDAPQSSMKHSPLLSMMAPKRPFTFEEVLRRGKEMSLALHHLHCSLSNTVVLVHRDLKPDNVAFRLDGQLVLFDLGLSTLVRRSDVADQTYEMTGQTGSLRYMAPEVMMSKPYNEKVDVYSFAIILWQMASGELPYDGASKADFVKFVGKRGERPELAPYMSWPKDFKDLLVSCWAQSSKERPAFDVVITRLDKLILKTGDSSGECGCVTV
jgi:serine/threonine protein kinase